MKEVNESGNVQDQRDLAVSENGGAGHAFELLEVGFQALDDHLLLFLQAVHEQARMLSFRFHHQQALFQVFNAATVAKQAVETDDGNVLVTKTVEFA